MAKKAYNGFSIQDRHVSSRLYRLDLRNHVFPNPKQDACEACGQGTGQLESHREDYSLAGPDGLITLCYRCHRMVHLRDNNSEAWDSYREALRRGFRWPPTRAIGTVIGDHISNRVLPGPPVNPQRKETILDAVDDGRLLAESYIQAERMKQLYARYQELEQEGLVKPLAVSA